MELYKLVKKFYGYKTNNIYINSKKNEVIAELYEAFITKYDIDIYHNEFGAGILLGNGEQVLAGEILGQKLTMSANEDSIVNSLSIIDNYCRLRLPDKFLEAYDNAYKNKKEHQN